MLSLSQLSEQCVKCAKCIPSCTIYQVNRDEVTSPRGFIDLLGLYDTKNLELDNSIKDIFETCFLCTTCTTQCPKTIPTATMIVQSRIQIAEKFGITWFKRMYFFLLRHRKIMDIVFSFTSFIAPCFFKQNQDKLRSRFNLSKLGKRTIFPFHKKSFLQQYSGIIPSKNSPNPAHSLVASTPTHNTTYKNKKVAIFIGCLSNYNYINVGTSLLKILDTLGIDTLVPKQECCGAPAYFTGDIKSVVFLAKKNIEYFESFFDEIDALIIPEATCAAVIMEDWSIALEYAGELELKNRLEQLMPKIQMATKYLYDKTNLLAILRTKDKKNLKITYHDPCHAKKVLNISKEPRELLKSNYMFVEMKECDRCCGFGGITIQSQKYHLAYNAGLAKAKHIQNSNANIVSAECSACRMQLNNALDNQQVTNVSFKHPLELINEILQS